jgi:carboxyl-terminal processing protease
MTRPSMWAWLVAACLLAFATARVNAASGATDAEAQLFAGALADIAQFYIEPAALRPIALSGAAQLHDLDRSVAVTDRLAGGPANTLTLLYDNRDADDFALPAADDAAGWGNMLAEVIADAERVSPTLAALPHERIDNLVMDRITETLDPFSRYVAPASARDDRAGRDGYGGIGVALDASDNRLRVADVSPDSPAALAGIRANDRIVAIDGAATAGWSGEAARERLRGPVGSAVVLRVQPPDGGPMREVDLRRAFVTEASVTAARDGAGVLVLRISGFDRLTAARAGAAIEAAQRQAPLAGIVLDLRGNPGGLLDQGVGLADLFIGAGPIVSTVGRAPGSNQYFTASGDIAVAPRVPMAVLINGGSASAAEIVAAALQDAGRAVVIGSSSYGKGTVQSVLRLPNDGELILTWARLIARGGYRLQHRGVVPTLCTALLPADAGASLAVRMQQAAAVAFALAPPQPRAALDDAAWAALRRLCPPRQTTPEIDLALAERLIANPGLYAEALRALPAPAAAVTASP